ncbi:hypothetical protein HYH03_002837 [Edaphochlamys debaryana]|uniref:Uncharacterized protein n=1 Tax=Edaphochlamys debaryana TaxID=47281 RepID=A0A836C4T7_9CHLO|nr:hypothetical protein HYH03_002837 [Edaphochlamys debaryana]|eukprot:KAG2499258.1 hypothetical protein HYH03_002837 [Edaphochlamys debaryana]
MPCVPHPSHLPPPHAPNVKLSDDAPGPRLTFSARIVGTEAEPAEGLELEVWNSLDQINRWQAARRGPGEPITVRVRPHSKRLTVHRQRRRGLMTSLGRWGPRGTTLREWWEYHDQAGRGGQVGAAPLRLLPFLCVLAWVATSLV